MVYGWAMSGTNQKTKHFREIALQRIDPTATGDSMSGVVAVWVATAPEGGAVVIGWYEDATVFRRPQSNPGDDRRVFRNSESGEVDPVGYVVSGPASKAVLLPNDERTISAPQGGKGEFGQSNLWYADDPDTSLHREIREKVLRAIQGVVRKDADHAIGRTHDVLRKQKVETAAINCVTEYYVQNGYDVRSVAKDNVGWDLEATLGDRLLRIEVKGLSGSEIVVELTPNEYRMMREHQQSFRLCIVTNALKLPSLEIFYYSDEWNGWSSSTGRRLAIKEIVSARCSVNITD